MNYYYLTPENKPVGPMPLEGMCDMVEGGQLSASVMVAKEGDTAWRPLMTVAAEHGRTLTVEGAPGPCPTCGRVLEVQADGGLPLSCPHCGRALRPVAGKEQNLWYNFTLALRQYAKFTGRATRMEYWSFALFANIIIFPLNMVTEVFAALSEVAGEDDWVWSGLTLISVGVYLLVALGLTIPSYAVMTRRLHDVGWSGKWVLALAIATVVCTVAVATGAALFIVQNMDSPDETVWTPGVVAAIVVAIVSYLVIIGTGLLSFVLSFFDSKRGPNKYGPSRKYPLG